MRKWEIHAYGKRIYVTADDAEQARQHGGRLVASMQRTGAEAQKYLVSVQDAGVKVIGETAEYTSPAETYAYWVPSFNEHDA